MNPDRDRNPESRKGNCFARAAVPAAALFLLAGCSSVPDWADPTEWFGSDLGSQSGESASGYPNLASVPGRPKAPSEEDLKRLADSLTADRQNAEYSKDVIRRQSAAPVPAPPPPPSASAIARQAVTPLPSPPSPIASSAPVVSGALLQAPVSRPPQFAPRPQAPVAPGAGANSVAPLSMQPGPNARSVARIGNPSFGAPPADIAAAMGAGSLQRSAPSRFAAPAPRISGTVLARGPAATGEPAAVVRFRAGSASLTSNARQQVRKIVQMYRERGGGVRVEGHASSRTRNMDPVQHHLVNFNVSLNRANAVARELVRQGIPTESVFVAALSDSQPLYYEVMPAGDAGNQRVEIHYVN